MPNDFLHFNVWMKILKIQVGSTLFLNDFFLFGPTRMREATVAVTIFTQF